MELKTYLKDKKISAASKYSHLKLMVSSGFHSLQAGAISKLKRLKSKAASKFHLQKNQVQNIFHVQSKAIKAEDSPIGVALKDDQLLDGSGMIYERFVQPRAFSLNKNFDATNKIHKGARVVSIIVRQGEIVERVYSPLQGE